MVQEEQPFIAEMHRRFEIADSQSLHGLAWGYLNVINGLQPGAPVLRRELRDHKFRVEMQIIERKLFEAGDIRILDPALNSRFKQKYSPGRMPGQ